MKTKIINLCLVLLIFLSSCNTGTSEEESIQNTEPPDSTTEITSDILYIEHLSSLSEEERLKKNPYMFSFADSSGKKLLISEGGEDQWIGDIPHTYNIALDENGKVYPVKYLYAQDFNPEYDTGRQIPTNFNYTRGIVYQIEGESLGDEYDFFSKSYLMCTTEFFETNRYLEPKPFNSGGLEKIRLYIENESNRKVSDLWQESEYEKGIGFYFAYFEPIGDNLLAAAIFYDGENIGACYYPARMDDSGTTGWRLEDYGIIGDLTIKTLCALNSVESILIFFYWYDSEGINIQLVEWDGIELKDKGAVHGRYTLS